MKPIPRQIGDIKSSRSTIQQRSKFDWLESWSGITDNGTLGKINDMKTFGLMISDIRIMRERVLLMPGQSEIAGTENEKVKSDLFEISSVHLNSYEKKTNDSDLPDESLLFSPNQRKGITVPEAKEGKV